MNIKEESVKSVMSLSDVKAGELDELVEKAGENEPIWRDRNKSLRELEMKATAQGGQGDKESVRSDKMSITLPVAPEETFTDPNATSGSDWVKYILENNISANPNVPFMLLASVFVLAMFVFASIWSALATQTSVQTGEDIFGSTWTDALFMHLQLITAAGYDDNIPDQYGLRYIFFFSIFFGLVIFAILVGFITDSVGQFMGDLDTGRTKVAEDGHTLILGWNEATMRVVVQTSFLRRQYQMLNESKYFGILYYFPFLAAPLGYFEMLERPSTSLANSDICIMADNKSKEEMHILLEQTLSERGINPARTRLGMNIICRIGDPTNTNDLIRVAAYKAAAIVVMMTESDQEEEDVSEGKIRNGATLRVCLALRHVLFSHTYSPTHNFHPELRIVLQMTSPSEYVDATNFQNPQGNNVIIPMDLAKFLNSLMFLCAAQPGLSKVLLGILDFEGPCIRRRKAKNLRSGPDNMYGACIGQSFGDMRKQFTKAIFIGIIRPGMPHSTIKSQGFGLLPKPETIIEEDDLLIFIGPKSNPVHDFGMINVMNGYLEEARVLLKKHPNIEKGRLMHKEERIDHVEQDYDDTASDDSDASSPIHGVKKQENMIICGWRPVWEIQPARLHDRVMEVACMGLPGSTITFINFVEEDKFQVLMEKVGYTRIDDVVHDIHGEFSCRMYVMGKPYSGIKIKHFYGDAAEADTIETIMSVQTIHTAIVLGTQANFQLPPRSRDTRVLNIMLLLRKFWAVKNELVPMHIVGENQQDMTAKLALGPRLMNDIDMERNEKNTGAAGGRRIGKYVERQPDFINTQAVFARAITQTLAYPLIREAVNELLQSGPGFVDVVIVNAAEYLPLGVPIVYGVVRAMVLLAAGERSICLGIMPISGDPKVNPEHMKKYTFNRDDRLIILRRELLPGEESAV